MPIQIDQLKFYCQLLKINQEELMSKVDIESKVNIIERAFRHVVAPLHPDKCHGLPEEQKNINLEQFKLLTNARDNLITAVRTGFSAERSSYTEDSSNIYSFGHCNINNFTRYFSEDEIFSEDPEQIILKSTDFYNTVRAFNMFKQGNLLAGFKSFGKGSFVIEALVIDCHNRTLIPLVQINTVRYVDIYKYSSLEKFFIHDFIPLPRKFKSDIPAMTMEIDPRLTAAIMEAITQEIDLSKPEEMEKLKASLRTPTGHIVHAIHNFFEALIKCEKNVDDISEFAMLLANLQAALNTEAYRPIARAAAAAAPAPDEEPKAHRPPRIG